MKSHARIGLLREAVEAGDVQAALALLAQIQAGGYPAPLLRSVLASCHPGLDPCYLDLHLVPASLLLAPCLPGALACAPLDPLQLRLAHGCEPATFVAKHLNRVLRGEFPLYPSLPTIDIRNYQLLVQRSPARCSWLRQLTALECLALEAKSGVVAHGSALNRWAPSRHDDLLEHPWIWIQGPGQALGGLLSYGISVEAVRVVSDSDQAANLIADAARHGLGGGTHYLLWNQPEPPPDQWGSLIRGLVAHRGGPLCQIGNTRQGLEEIRPVRHSQERALLAIDALWLARRSPRQVLAFLRHWLAGPPPHRRPRLSIELLGRRDPPLRHKVLDGLLVLAANRHDLQEQGREQLEWRAAQRAQEGGFAEGAVLELDGPSGQDVAAQLKRLGNSLAGTPQVLALMGADDRTAPGAWEHLARHLAWADEDLLCSDEELIWRDDPVMIGQRQFIGPPTPFRLLSRGQLPGLVALPAALLTDLEWQPTYRSLHALLKDLGLQWLERQGNITTLPQALLHRSPRSNPAVLAITTPADRQPFSGDQLLELDQITQRRAQIWLGPGGTLERGSLDGSFRLRRTQQPGDRVSVIIPFRNQAALTRSCVESLIEQAGSTPLELVLVDNGSNEVGAVGLAEALAPLAESRGITLIGVRDDSPFNFSALNNRARRRCTGNFLLFLNNDVRFASPQPVEALLDPFAMTGTGAVSARLLYEDGTIQHHGLVAAALQPHDILSAGKGLLPGIATAPFTILKLQEEWSAATAACLLMRSEEFDRLGGFDEDFTVAYNDVDLCWRLSNQGLAVIVTPEPRIFHAESKSRGEDIAGEKRNRLARESGVLRRRYPVRFQQGDPLYNHFLDPASHCFEPVTLPAQPLAISRAGLLYSWVRPKFQPACRPFLIYVHWDPDGEVRPDIFEQLQAYRHHADLAFVSASPALLSYSRTMTRLHQLCDIVLVRHNEGYDFGSWQTGILFCRPYLDRTTRLILTNDSCYGPLHSLDGLFKRLAASHADVVGLTESTALRPHLQSYFIAYGRRVMSCSLFWTFWDQIGIWTSKVDLVRAYEVGWSDILTKAGFRTEALYLAGEHGNVTHTHWRQLLEELGFPFIKTELLRVNPILQDINAWQNVAGKINPRITQMIEDHLSRYKSQPKKSD